MGREEEEGRVTRILQRAREGSAEFRGDVVKFKRRVSECERDEVRIERLESIRNIRLEI